MSEPEKKVEDWRSDYNWLSRRIDRLENEMREQCRNHARRIRLFVRILVDKKIIGEEVAKSIEEVFAEDGEAIDEEAIKWLLESIEDDNTEKKE